MVATRRSLQPASPASRRGHRGNDLRLRPHAARVLELIWSERGISRAEVARRIDLPRSTVSQTVSALVAAGLVSERGVGASRGGRRPVILETEDEAFGVVGVDLDHAHVAVVLTDLRGQVESWEERDHPVREDPQGTRALVVELVEHCLAGWRLSRDRLAAIGVAVPSPVDRGAANPLSPVAMPAWRGRLGLEVLEERFRVPVWVDNDANLGALAEHHLGAGRGIDDLLYLKISQGFGSGHLLDGRIYRGATGVAGEMGHVQVDPSGPACACGLHGCLNVMVTTPAITARTRAMCAEAPGSLLERGTPGLAELEDAALRGDAVADRVVQETARLLGIGVVGVLNVLNPALVIVGGDLAMLGDVLLGPLRRAVRESCRNSSAGEASVAMSPLGDRAMALGAATHALLCALAEPSCFPQRAGR